MNLDEVIAGMSEGRIKALSIKQPYPHHIFHDGKEYLARPATRASRAGGEG